MLGSLTLSCQTQKYQTEVKNSVLSYSGKFCGRKFLRISRITSYSRKYYQQMSCFVDKNRAIALIHENIIHEMLSLMHSRKFSPTIRYLFPVSTLLTLSISGFILGTACKMHRFMASSVEEKTAWYTELHKLIHTQKQLFNKV